MYQKSYFIKELKRRGITKHPETQRNLKHSKISELARIHFTQVEKEEKAIR